MAPLKLATFIRFEGISLKNLHGQDAYAALVFEWLQVAQLVLFCRETIARKKNAFSKGAPAYPFGSTEFHLFMFGVNIAL